MLNMDVWDVVIWLSAGYLAVFFLARKIRRHREREVIHWRQQLETDQQTSAERAPPIPGDSQRQSQADRAARSGSLRPSSGGDRANTY